MKYFEYTIRWNRKDYYIKSYTNMRVSTLINECTRTLRLQSKSPAQYSLEYADGRILESDSVIPSTGITDVLILKYRNQNTTIVKKLEETRYMPEYDRSSVDKQSVRSILAITIRQQVQIPCRIGDPLRTSINGLGIVEDLVATEDSNMGWNVCEIR